MAVGSLGTRCGIAAPPRFGSSADTLRRREAARRMPESNRRRTFVVLSQVFVPDPASVGQHMADAAMELARRGHRVIVFTANRGYDDPTLRYPSHERLGGVEVVRLPFSSFGKGSIASRLLGGVSLLLQAIVRVCFVGRVDAILVSTSPPIAPLGGVVMAWLKRARLKFWVMDLNPDQVVAIGLAAPDALSVRAFDWMNRLILRAADDTVVLDRFMERRVRAKGQIGGRVHVMPPWPLDLADVQIEHADNPWRTAQGLRDEIVVMYSGNHSPSNPLATVLEAAKRLRDEPRIAFFFVGGGAGKVEVEAAVSSNLRSLPYQPKEELTYSLSAADVHLVSMGNEVVGIVHPCKIYGAMSVGRPVLALGPLESHVGELVDGEDIGWRIAHGDVDGAERVFRQLLEQPEGQRHAMGAKARALITARLSRAALLGAFCDVLELGLRTDV